MRIQPSSLVWLDGGEDRHVGLVTIGRAADGRSVAVVVSQCPIYFYALVRVDNEAVLVDFVTQLRAVLSEKGLFLKNHDVVERTPADGYRKDKCGTLRLHFATFEAAKAAHKLMGDPNEWLEGPTKRALTDLQFIKTAEGTVKVDAASRALADAAISPEDTIELSEHHQAPYCSLLTTCAVELHVTFEEFKKSRVDSTEPIPKTLMSLHLVTEPDESGDRENFVSASVVWCTGDGPRERRHLNSKAGIHDAVRSVAPDIMVGHGTHRHAMPWLFHNGLLRSWSR